MKSRTYSQWKFGLVLGIGALIALVLCVQCVRTYLYADAVLVPKQAEHEAARQTGALTAAARSAGITDPRRLKPAIEHVIESASDRVLWMRLLDRNGAVTTEGGTVEASAKLPANWWTRLEQHASPSTLVDTPQGRALVVVLPFRLPRPLHPSKSQAEKPAQHPTATSLASSRPDTHAGSPDDRHQPYALEVAISLKSVAHSFDDLRRNLILGVIVSIALLVALAVIALRAPHYVRGKYLESELQLARRVQHDLQPKPQSVSRHIEFAASAVAADHVGGDFFDIFEAESGKIVIVLGDVAGKGVPAALLVSVLHGAIRSSTTSRHELACARINRMLCERSACERFATLFWGIFDPDAGTLTYVNAGHAAPMLLRNHSKRVERLSEGGPVLGLLPGASYSTETVQIDPADTLVLYSDGITEAMDTTEQEFGEERIEHIARTTSAAEPALLRDRLIAAVTAFAGAEAPQDDRTLMIVKFQPSEHADRARPSEAVGMAAVA